MRSAINKMFGDEIEHDVIDELMAVADTDANGEIDLDEFKAAMRLGHKKLGGLTRAMLTLRVICATQRAQ